MANSNTLTLRFDTKLSRRLDRLAKTTRRDRCELVRPAIRELLSLNEGQIMAIKKGLREAEAGNFASGGAVEEMFKKWERMRAK